MLSLGVSPSGKTREKGREGTRRRGFMPPRPYLYRRVGKDRRKMRIRGLPGPKGTERSLPLSLSGSGK